LLDLPTPVPTIPPGGVDSTGTLGAPPTGLVAYPVILPENNARVNAFVAAYTGSKRRTFQSWLDRSGPYFPMVASVLQREHLPIELACVVFIESGSQLGARSWAQAIGPWQFMAGTARLFGLSVTRDIDERHDMQRSTEAAARMFTHLYNMFGSWPLCLAAYNAGEGRVQRAIQRQGTTNYWALRLPRETENYVAQFMAILVILRDPARYGFTLPGSQPLVYREVAVTRGTRLSSLARELRVSAAVIARLNPAYKRGWAPAGSKVKLPIASSPAPRTEVVPVSNIGLPEPVLPDR
jgi:membrane-bound lytic murein transglycosylase D